MYGAGDFILTHTELKLFMDCTIEGLFNSKRTTVTYTLEHDLFDRMSMDGAVTCNERQYGKMSRIMKRMSWKEFRFLIDS